MMKLLAIWPFTLITSKPSNSASLFFISFPFSSSSSFELHIGYPLPQPCLCKGSYDLILLSKLHYVGIWNNLPVLNINCMTLHAMRMFIEILMFIKVCVFFLNENLNLFILSWIATLFHTKYYLTKELNALEKLFLPSLETVLAKEYFVQVSCFELLWDLKLWSSTSRIKSDILPLKHVSLTMRLN